MFAYDRPLLAACRQLQAMTMIVGPRQACARERSQAYRAARRTRKSLRHLV